MLNLIKSTIELFGTRLINSRTSIGIGYLVIAGVLKYLGVSDNIILQIASYDNILLKDLLVIFTHPIFYIIATILFMIGSFYILALEAPQYLINRKKISIELKSLELQEIELNNKLNELNKGTK